MGDEKDRANTQRDKNLAAEERPIPSQAEGDVETVEQDLKQKEKQKEKKKQPSASKESSS